MKPNNTASTPATELLKLVDDAFEAGRNYQYGETFGQVPTKPLNKMDYIASLQLPAATAHPSPQPQEGRLYVEVDCKDELPENETEVFTMSANGHKHFGKICKNEKTGRFYTDGTDSIMVNTKSWLKPLPSPSSVANANYITTRDNVPQVGWLFVKTFDGKRTVYNYTGNTISLITLREQYEFFIQEPTN